MSLWFSMCLASVQQTRSLNATPLRCQAVQEPPFSGSTWPLIQLASFDTR